MLVTVGGMQGSLSRRGSASGARVGLDIRRRSSSARLRPRPAGRCAADRRRPPARARLGRFRAPRSNGETTLAIVNTPAQPDRCTSSGRPTSTRSPPTLARLRRATALRTGVRRGSSTTAASTSRPAARPRPAPNRALVLRSFSKTLRDGGVADRLSNWPRRTPIDAMAPAPGPGRRSRSTASPRPRRTPRSPARRIGSRRRAAGSPMRPRAIEAADATGILRAELPEAAAFVWAAVDGDEDELERPPGPRARHHRASRAALRRPRARISGSRSAAGRPRARHCSSGSQPFADTSPSTTNADS